MIEPWDRWLRTRVGGVRGWVVRRLGREWRVVDRDGRKDSCSKIRGWWVIGPWDRWLWPRVGEGRGWVVRGLAADGR